ncbi:U6 snRNA-associated Sm-like protein LSm6 [Pycnococcus provasolii]|mmetsp:Transcript_6354/g.16492  ORF Transcript_6354/g.16492 Transcript_6354/m.16492 type:complete len:90 (+) Transcript_6354:5-274(+)
MSAAAAPSSAQQSKSTPSDFLRTIRGRPVTVRLTTGVDYRGVLVQIDGYMNVALEGCEEWNGTQLKAKYGDAFLRGNNVLYISATSGAK